jgi:hypothetical protein
MDFQAAREKASARGLSTYQGLSRGGSVSYELGLLFPEETCTVGREISLHDEPMRWIVMGRGTSWEEAFKDLELHIN